jgi:nuclear pore complex protein Nup133
MPPLQIEIEGRTFYSTIFFSRVSVTIDHVKAAYELAERHRDFRSLVELCNDPQHGSTSRIRVLLEKYGEEFAFALYHFYVEQGESSCLFTEVIDL